MSRAQLLDRAADVADRLAATAIEGADDVTWIGLTPLPEEHWDRWLDRDFEDVGALKRLLVPAADDGLTEYPVSTLVNSVRNNLPECIVPLEGVSDED